MSSETPLYLAMLDAIQSRMEPALFQKLVGDMGRDFIRTGWIAAAPETPWTTLLQIMRRDIPGLLLWQLNTAIHNPLQRSKLASIAAKLAPAVPFDAAPDSDCAARLARDGFTRLPALLDAAELGELRDHLASRPRIIAQETNRHNHIDDVARAPHVLKLATHPFLLSLARNHLGGAPTIVELDAWWSPATARDDHNPQVFHRDKDDFSACKFFLYLTDVPDNAHGPHEYIGRTHDVGFVSQAMIARGYPPVAVENVFNTVGGGRELGRKVPSLFPEQMIEVLGPAGTCFMTNSYGYHRGRPPAAGTRGILAVAYAMIGYPNRFERFAPITLDGLPPALDTPIARHAARLMFLSH